ncbi:hypothetical protein ACLQ24_29775, partial [Micromonospora sp. DT4]|uniref:hypothetical protein n=1 Tax=Micromonospora sp. DT4 TaxID=3393438 RepID=UPI003CEEF9FC
PRRPQTAVHHRAVVASNGYLKLNTYLSGSYHRTYGADDNDAIRIDHPRSVYVGERQIIDQLDPLLVRALLQSRVPVTKPAVHQGRQTTREL